MTGPTQGNQSQYSALSGTWSYALTYTLSDATLFDVKAHWAGKINVFAEPQFQVTQSPALTPAQYALQVHVLQVKFPEWGGFLIQGLLDAQYQWQGSNGAASVVPGVQIAHKQFSWLQLQTGLNIGAAPGANGGLKISVDPQPSFNAWMTFTF